MEGLQSYSSREVIIGLLVAVGILTVVKELLFLSDRMRLAEELERNPHGPADAAEEFLREREDENGDNRTD